MQTVPRTPFVRSTTLIPLPLLQTPWFLGRLIHRGVMVLPRARRAFAHALLGCLPFDDRFL